MARVGIRAKGIVPTAGVATLQTNNAGVKTDSPVRRSDRTPVVTHALSEQMSMLPENCQDLITRYAFLSAMADCMHTAIQLNRPTADLASFRENRVRSRQEQARRWIDDGTNRYSVAGLRARRARSSPSPEPPVVSFGSQ